VIYRYGIIWLIWIVVNRFLCEELLMVSNGSASGVLAG
jgi:hypothetical protein